MSSERKRRVWQWTKFDVEQSDKALNDGRILFAVNPPPRVCTYNREKGMVNGTSIPEKCIVIRPNAVGQYILEPTAEFYDEQAKALEQWAIQLNGIVKEVTESKDFKVGSIPRELMPKRPISAREQELEAENARLKEQLEKKEIRK